MASNKKNGNVIGEVVAGLTGFLAGVTAMFFSEKKNREKVEKKVSVLVRKGKKLIKRRKAK